MFKDTGIILEGLQKPTWEENMTIHNDKNPKIVELEQEIVTLKAELKQADALVEIRNEQLEKLKKRVDELIQAGIHLNNGLVDRLNKTIDEKIQTEQRAEKIEATRDFWHGEFERVGNQYEATLEKLEKAEADVARERKKIEIWKDNYTKLEKQAEEWEEKLEKAETDLATLKEAVEEHRLSDRELPDHLKLYATVKKIKEEK